MGNSELRNAVYTILTVVAVSAVLARIAGTEFLFEPSMYPPPGAHLDDAPKRIWPSTRPAPMPTFSSNDRSRWCAVRELVDHGTWVIGHRDNPDDPATDSGVVFEDGWQTVDKVKKPETGDYYSSKPPLLTVIVAGEYWLLKHTLHWEITRDTNKVVKTILITLNAVPLVFYLLMLQRLLERSGTTDWGRLFVFVSACFGTYITTFSVSLNNHTPAAVAALLTVYPFLMCKSDDGRFLGFIPVPTLPSMGWLCVSAFAAGVLACLELPALAFTVALAFLISIRSPVRGLAIFLPIALFAIGVEFAINRLATGEWLTYTTFGGPWYEYPGSHWLKPLPGEIKHGIDWSKMHESRAAYIFHCLLGHHGLFSLTPIWLFAFWGMLRESFRARVAKPPVLAQQFLFPLALVVSLIVIVFYLCISGSRNYGGWNSGLRWLFWFTPLWLFAMLPVVNRLSVSKSGRFLAYSALVISIFSATYPIWNPWRHPWFYRLMESQEWIKY